MLFRDLADMTIRITLAALAVTALAVVIAAASGL
jgi:hypothetical protein